MNESEKAEGISLDKSNIQKNPKKKISISAVFSIVLALIGIPFIFPSINLASFFSPWPPGPIALPLIFLCVTGLNFPVYLSIILGFKSIKDMKSNKLIKGKGIAIAGIVIGFLSFLFNIFVIYSVIST